MHFDDEITSHVLLLKIVNFKLNCSFESFSTGETLSLEFSPCLLQELFNAVLKKKWI